MLKSAYAAWQRISERERRSYLYLAILLLVLESAQAGFQYYQRSFATPIAMQYYDAPQASFGYNLPDTTSTESSTQSAPPRTYRAATTKYQKIKQPKAPPVNINSADSAQLVALPGIGPFYAKRILKYRDLLGGFHRKEQLLEVYGFDKHYPRTEDHINCSGELRRMDLHSASASTLYRHPYLGKSIAQQVLRLRKQGSLALEVDAQVQQLELDSTHILKLRPYLSN